MSFGLSEAEFQEVHQKLVIPLVKKGAKVWVFGSRARGSHQRFSDLDIMVEGGERIDIVIAEIKEYFENSNFPYKIDLVEDENFAESYRENYLKERVSWPG